MKTDDIINLYRHDFSSFIRFAFNELHSGIEYQHNWHIDVMAHYLNKVANGEIKRLVINLPPRMLKSHCASIAFPAWILGRMPQKKILCLHAGKALGRDLSDSCSHLMQSRRYRALFPHIAVEEKSNRLNVGLGGQRQYMPIMGRLTGLGADIVIIDDPISTAEARDKQARKRLHDQFDENILQRFDNKENGAIILVMQRVHEDDLSAHVLQKGGWTHLNLPVFSMEDEKWELPDGKFYERKKGEFLHPEREIPKQVLITLFSIGGYAFAYQYMQGLYKPHFGEEGEGCIWLTPYREGEFWDARKEGIERPTGFYKFNEIQLILARVFGLMKDPCPPDMRNKLTPKEWVIAALETQKNQEKLIQECENQES